MAVRSILSALVRKCERIARNANSQPTVHFPSFGLAPPVVASRAPGQVPVDRPLQTARPRGPFSAGSPTRASSCSSSSSGAPAVLGVLIVFQQFQPACVDRRCHAAAGPERAFIDQAVTGPSTFSAHIA